MSEAAILPPETEDGPARIQTPSGTVIDLEKVTSTRVSAMAYDDAVSALYVTFPSGMTYEYQGVEQDVFESAITAESIGKFLNEHIIGKRGKPAPYPYRVVIMDPQQPQTISPVSAISAASIAPLPIATDAGQSSVEIIPVVRDILSKVPIPEDDAQLPSFAQTQLYAARQLIKRDAQNRPIIGGSAAYLAAENGLLAMKEVRKSVWDRLQKVVEPTHKAWKAAVALRDEAVGPYDQAEKELKEAMLQFHWQEDDRRRAEELAETRRLEAEAAEDAKVRAQEEADKEAAHLEAQGDIEEAVQVRSNPLPLAPAYVPPVILPSAVPSSGATSMRENWTFEITNPTEIPLSHEWYTLDERKLTAYVKSMKSHAKVPGVRFYDKGTISTGRSK